MRAVLFASATATTILGRRRRSPITHGSALVAFERSRLALAPLISSRLPRRFIVWSTGLPMQSAYLRLPQIRPKVPSAAAGGYSSADSDLFRFPQVLVIA